MLLRSSSHLLRAGALTLLLAFASGLPHGQAMAQIDTVPFDCLTTPNGIPRKAIVKKQNAVAYEKEDFSGTEQPLKFFRKYFVFRESGKGFLIGDATVKASAVGWVRQEDVIPWDTEQALFFINKKAEDRAPVRVWRSKDDVGKSDKPLFEERLDRDFTTEPFPVMQKDGPFLNIAFLWDAEGAIPTLHQNLGGKPEKSGGGDQTVAGLLRGAKVERGTEGKQFPGGQIELAQVQQKAKRLDVVLVIDVTGSMGQYMDKVRAKLVDIVDALRKMAAKGPEASIYVGVVAYRDFADEKTTYLTKRLELTKDMDAVKGFFSSTDFSPQGGAGRNEAVCDAIFEACQKMSWGEHSTRIICLVGDAPPHTENDEDIQTLRSAETPPSSQFFSQPFERSADIVKEELKKNRVVFFYPMSVAGYEDTEKAFKQLANDPKRFLSLADADKFIKGMEEELGKMRVAHDAALGAMPDVAAGKILPSDLSPEVQEIFGAMNIDPAVLAEMKKELIQTGWFNAKEAIGKDVAVTVYLRRPDLERWAEVLRTQLLAYREKEPEVLKGIAATVTGGPVKASGLTDLFKLATDIAVQPDIFKAKYVAVEDEVKIRNLRRKLNNLLILTYTEGLFSKYDEGWVPIEYLPGSMAEFGSPADSGGK